MGDNDRRPREVPRELEPCRRTDGTWSVAVFRHGIRELIGRFKSKADAEAWIIKNQKSPDEAEDAVAIPRQADIRLQRNK